MPLTADRNTPFRDTEMISVPVAGGVKIFVGAMVCANANGMATPGATSLTLTYLGRSDQFVDNTLGIDGALSVTVRRRKSFKWINNAADPITQASLGQPVYIVDDFSVAKTNGVNTRSPGGKLVGFDADGGVWVE